MSTDRKTTLAVRSWLEEGVTRLPDRVLDAVLDQIPATPQRRHAWSAWRFNQMPAYLKLIAGAAALVLVAVVGYQVLPRNGGIGGPAPSPSPSLLAHGDFTTIGATVRLDATGAGDNVTGTLAVTKNDGDFSVALRCARSTSSGVLWIAGDVTTSTDLRNAPLNTRAGIVIQRGAQVKAIFVFQANDPRSASCPAFFDDMIKLLGGDPDFSTLAPIVGTVQLAP